MHRRPWFCCEHSHESKGKGCLAHQACRWYEQTPKWKLGELVAKLAAMVSEANGDAGLDSARKDGWFPIAKKEAPVSKPRKPWRPRLRRE